MTLPVAVLVSGRGSNLQAILDACASGELDARVAIVVSNHAGVPALQRAALAGVPSAVFTLRTYSDRTAAHSAMAAAIAGVGAELVVLAGFDHILAPIFFVRLAGVPALQRAALAGVPSAVFTLRTYSDRAAAHSAMAVAIAGVGAELVVLAGFDHILAPIFFVRLSGVPVINLHPALLPLFGGRGMHGDKVHEAVLASGATESGCTVHRVHPETVDLGEVVVQRRVPVEPGDTAATLAARVLEQEHGAIVDAIRRFVPTAVSR